MTSEQHERWVVFIVRAASEMGQLFGSKTTARDISAALVEAGHQIDRKLGCIYCKAIDTWLV